jgi:hypothetical protein
LSERTQAITSLSFMVSFPFCQLSLEVTSNSRLRESTGKEQMQYQKLLPIGRAAAAIGGLIQNPRCVVLLMAMFADSAAGAIVGKIPWGGPAGRSRRDVRIWNKVERNGSTHPWKTKVSGACRTHLIY